MFLRDQVDAAAETQRQDAEAATQQVEESKARQRRRLEQATERERRRLKAVEEHARLREEYERHMDEQDRLNAALGEARDAAAAAWNAEIVELRQRIDDLTETHDPGTAYGQQAEIEQARAELAAAIATRPQTPLELELESRIDENGETVIDPGRQAMWDLEHRIEALTGAVSEGDPSASLDTVPVEASDAVPADQPSLDPVIGPDTEPPPSDPPEGNAAAADSPVAIGPTPPGGGGSSHDAIVGAPSGGGSAGEGPSSAGRAPADPTHLDLLDLTILEALVDAEDNGLPIGRTAHYEAGFNGLEGQGLITLDDDGRWRITTAGRRALQDRITADLAAARQSEVEDVERVDRESSEPRDDEQQATEAARELRLAELEQARDELMETLRDLRRQLENAQRHHEQVWEVEQNLRRAVVQDRLDNFTMSDPGTPFDEQPGIRQLRAELDAIDAEQRSMSAHELSLHQRIDEQNEELRSVLDRLMDLR